MNVSAQGNMTLVINISAMVTANPSAASIVVSILALSLGNGAVLLVDSSGPLSGTPTPNAVILIRQLVGSNGGLVFRGTFPPRTTILVDNASMTADNQISAPRMPSLDPVNPVVAKLVMLVNVSLTSNSTLILVNTTLKILLNCFGIYMTDLLRFQNGSSLLLQSLRSYPITGGGTSVVFSSCSVTATTLSSIAITNGTLTSFLVNNTQIYITSSSSFQMAGSSIAGSSSSSPATLFHNVALTVIDASSLIFSSCVFTHGANIALLFRLLNMMVVGQSNWQFARCNFSSVTAAALSLQNSSILVNSQSNWSFSNCLFSNSFVMSASPVTLPRYSSWQFVNCSFAYPSNQALLMQQCTISITQGSVWILSGCFLRSGNQAAFSMESSPVYLNNLSSWVVSTNQIDAGTNGAAFQLDGNSRLYIGNSSWLLWTSNAMKSSSFDTCMWLQPALVIVASGTMSFTSNDCLTSNANVTKSIMRNASAGEPVAISGPGMFYDRCNYLNLVNEPNTALSVNSCQSCNATADCFGPLTVPGRACNASWPTGTAQCVCAPGGVGSSCLPLIPPFVTPPLVSPSLPTTAPTAAPTTSVPTSAAPTTTSPTSAAPTTTSPTSAAPTTTRPTSAAPTTTRPAPNPLCSFINVSLTSSLAIDTSCSTVIIVNVSAQGDMTIGIDVSAMATSNPTAGSIVVSIVRLSVGEGAVLLVDSSGPLSGTPMPNASILIRQLVGSNGGLVFRGTFPPRTTILVDNASMTADNQASAPTMPSLDPVNRTVAKLVMLVDVSLISSSSVVFQNSFLAVQLDPMKIAAALYMMGVLNLTSGSSLVVSRSTLNVASKQALLAQGCSIYLTGSSSFLVESSTFVSLKDKAIWIKSSSAIIVDGGSSFLFTSTNISTPNGGICIEQSSVVVKSNSILRLSKVSISSGDKSIWLKSPVTVNGSSIWSIDSCILASSKNAMKLEGADVAIDNTSCWLVVLNSMTAPSVPDAAFLVDDKASIQIGSSSWLLWASNSMSVSNSDTCMMIKPGLVIKAPGIISFINNNCTTDGSGTSTIMRDSTVGQPVAVLGSGLFYHRCNRLNDAQVLSSSLPSMAISVGSCSSSCNATAECFAPLTTPRMTCNTNSMTIGAAQCSCTAGGSGELCLPQTPTSPFPTTVAATVAPAATTSLPPSSAPSTLPSSQTNTTLIPTPPPPPPPQATAAPCPLTSSPLLVNATLRSPTKLLIPSGASVSFHDVQGALTVTFYFNSSSSPQPLQLSATLDGALITPAGKHNNTADRQGAVIVAGPAGQQWLRLAVEVDDGLGVFLSQPSVAGSIVFFNVTATATVVVASSACGSRNASVAATFSCTVEVPAAPVVNAATLATAQTAAAMSIVASSVAGPAAASDMQSVILVMLARCSSGSATRGDGYTLLTPFALSNTARGALGGNAVASAALLLTQVVVFGVARLNVRKAVAEASAANMQACAVARLPGYSILLAAALHQSTLFSAIRLMGSDAVGAIDVLMGLVALLFSLALPIALLIASAKVPRRFVAYEVRPGSRFAAVYLKPFVPVGAILPKQTRQMLSSVITSFANQSPTCVLFPFASSFVTNMVDVLPATSPTWLCSGFMYLSAAVHISLGMGIAVSSIHRVPLSRLLNMAGLVLTGIFHSLIGAGSRSSADALVTAQSVLSIGRSLCAILIVVVEKRMEVDEGVTRTAELWRVGDGGVGGGEGGVELASIGASLLHSSSAVDNEGERKEMDQNLVDRSRLSPLEQASANDRPHHGDLPAHPVVMSPPGQVEEDDGDIFSPSPLKATELVAQPFGLGSTTSDTLDDLRREYRAPVQQEHQARTAVAGPSPDPPKHDEMVPLLVEEAEDDDDDDLL